MGNIIPGYGYYNNLYTPYYAFLVFEIILYSLHVHVYFHLLGK